MILRQDQPSRYAGLKCASRKLSPRNLPRERFSSMARTRSPRMRLPRRQWEDEGNRSNNALVTQVDPVRRFVVIPKRSDRGKWTFGVDGITVRPF